MSEFQGALGFLRLAVERSWVIGSLLVLFFGASILGVPFPSALAEWSGAGFVFGLACILVSAVGYLIRRAAAFVEGRQDYAHERHEAQAKLDSLSGSEELMLYSLLDQLPQRFTIGDRAPAQPLLDKGILRPTQVLREGTVWSCTPHQSPQTAR